MTSARPKNTTLKHQSRSGCAENCRSHKVLRLRSEFIIHALSRFLPISHESDTSCFYPKPSLKASPNVSAIAHHCERLRTVDNGCERYDNESRTRLYPQTPRVKREPFATHAGKVQQKKACVTKEDRYSNMKGTCHMSKAKQTA